MCQQVFLEIAILFAGIVALCASESFLTRMRENVCLKVASSFAGIVALSAFERIFP